MIPGIPQADSQQLLELIRSRNLTSHTYNPALAEEIAQLIATQYGKALQGLQQELRRRAEQSR